METVRLVVDKDGILGTYRVKYNNDKSGCKLVFTKTDTVRVREYAVAGAAHTQISYFRHTNIQSNF